MYKRPSWEEYWLSVMDTTALRASCDRGRSSAIIVRDNSLLCTGYVGSPKGLPTCDDIGHLMRASFDERGGHHDHCVRTTHAEANAVAQAARRGISIDGATLYVNMTPCLDCTKLLINCGIVRIVARRRYHADHDSVQFLKDAGVTLVTLEDKVVEYDVS